MGGERLSSLPIEYTLVCWDPPSHSTQLVARPPQLRLLTVPARWGGGRRGGGNARGEVSSCSDLGSRMGQLCESQ